MLSAVFYRRLLAKALPVLFFLLSCATPGYAQSNDCPEGDPWLNGIAARKNKQWKVAASCFEKTFSEGRTGPTVVEAWICTLVAAKDCKGAASVQKKVGQNVEGSPECMRACWKSKERTRQKTIETPVGTSNESPDAVSQNGADPVADAPEPDPVEPQKNERDVNETRVATARPVVLGHLGFSLMSPPTVIDMSFDQAISLPYDTGLLLGAFAGVEFPLGDHVSLVPMVYYHHLESTRFIKGEGNTTLTSHQVDFGVELKFPFLFQWQWAEISVSVPILGFYRTLSGSVDIGLSELVDVDTSQMGFRTGVYGGFYGVSVGYGLIWASNASLDLADYLEGATERVSVAGSVSHVFALRVDLFEAIEKSVRVAEGN